MQFLPFAMIPYNRLPVERMFDIPSLVTVLYVRLAKIYRSAAERTSSTAAAT